MRIIPYPSPNFSERPQAPDMIIIHYTDMSTTESALTRLCDPEAKVSAHYLIAKTGEIYRLVEEDKVSHHAGVSHWRGRDSLNQYSIGIELDNPGHSAGKLVPFPKVQMETLMNLIRDIRTRYKIHDWNIIGHSDVAPDRKKDPGELFDWEDLAKEGIGLWPKNSLESHAPNPDEIGEMQKLLRQIGYKVPDTGEQDKETNSVIEAFQRHFCPLSLGKGQDYKTQEMLARVVKIFDN
jgi:N-acetylmuramoyl-L-alanine amidase